MYNKIYYPEKNWKKLLEGAFCFEMLAPFASHPSDRQRAIEMFYKSKANNVSLKQILDEALRFLKSKGKSDEDILEEIERIKVFYKEMSKFTKVKKKAWLITWEDNNKPVEDNVISIIDSRIAGEKIANFIEQYYIANSFSLENKFYFSFRYKLNPYPIIYSKTDDGITYMGDMKCGEKPYVRARVVKNLKYILNDSKIKLEWNDIDYKSFGH